MFNLRAKMITVGLLGAAAIVPVDFAKADQLGHASWYSLPANKTANGERMNPHELTAAHRSLPFGTRVLVENLSNGRSVVVRINDRGPFIGGRIIDLSTAAAASIGMIAAGTAKVRVTTADGGVLAALGETTAKAKDDGSRITEEASAATPEGAAAIVSAKMTGATDKEPKKEAKAAPKPSIQAKPSIRAKAETKPSSKAKVAAKTPKSKTLVAAKSPATKRAGSHSVRVAAAKRSKPSGGAQARVQLVAAVKRSKPSGSAKARVQMMAAPGIHAVGRRRQALEPAHDRRINGLREAGREAEALEPPHDRCVEHGASLRRARHHRVHEARADAATGVPQAG
jgi:rare lipoprotein A